MAIDWKENEIIASVYEDKEVVMQAEKLINEGLEMLENFGHNEKRYIVSNILKSNKLGLAITVRVGKAPTPSNLNFKGNKTNEIF